MSNQGSETDRRGPFYLRAGTAGDEAALTALYRETLGSGWSLSSFQTDLADPAKFYLLGFADRQPAGCSQDHAVEQKAAGTGCLAGFIAAFLISPDEAEILNVAVDALFRRRGLASALLKEMLTILRGKGVRSVYLEAASKNTAALRLYESAGFTRAGRRPGYYADPPDDALILVCQLND